MACNAARMLILALAGIPLGSGATLTCPLLCLTLVLSHAAPLSPPHLACSRT